MKINKLYKTLTQVSVFMFTFFCFSQNINFEKVLNELEKSEPDNAIITLEQIDTIKITLYDKASINFFLGEAHLMNDNHGLAYKFTKKSKELFNEVDKEKDVMDCNMNLLRILSHQNNVKIETKKILNELIEYASKTNDYVVSRAIYHNIASNYMDLEKGELANIYFDKYIYLARQNNDSLHISYGLMNKGVSFNEYIENTDSALYYFKKSLPTFFKYNDINTIAYNYNNQGRTYHNSNNYKEAIKYYLKADSINLKENSPKSKVVFYENISESYLKDKNYKKAAIYLDKLNKLKDSINDISQNLDIVEIKQKYDISEKEAERKQYQIFAIASLVLLFFVGITAFLIQKNTKRKQLIAEQDKALEKQKVATLLKDQEINNINAMIEGQEKERQRIANDLHDDLGGLMATIKLQFNTLQEQQTPDLFNKTNNLLDQAYNKIRSIAHAKNSGVIAKQGLLKAVKNMAHNVSSASVIDIEVTDFGLESRLENSLELSIFRIIQELTTNIIKHAEATHATISLTNHENSLNIMIEDNGKGFNANKVVRNNGMGLHSIEKRVEHLEGELKIESQINQGTTIIIDIPL